MQKMVLIGAWVDADHIGEAIIDPNAVIVATC